MEQEYARYAEWMIGIILGSMFLTAVTHLIYSFQIKHRNDELVKEFRRRAVMMLILVLCMAVACLIWYLNNLNA